MPVLAPLRQRLRALCQPPPRAQGGRRRPCGRVPPERPPGGEPFMTASNGSGPLLEVEDVVVRFPVYRGLVGTMTRRPRQAVQAVEGVSFRVSSGEMLALVGESGCGKTTTAQTVLRLLDPVSGSIRFEGRDITSLDARALRPLRRRMQIVYQDPYESLDPRLRVRAAVEEPLVIHRLGSRSERAVRVREALERVDLSPAD